MQSWINGALQNLFIFLLVNKPVLIVVGILPRVKTALLERSVTHFAKGEISVGVCSDLLFIYCAARLVTSSLNAVFLLFLFFLLDEDVNSAAQQAPGQQIVTSSHYSRCTFDAFQNYATYPFGALGRAALTCEYPQ